MPKPTEYTCEGPVTFVAPAPEFFEWYKLLPADTQTSPSTPKTAAARPLPESPVVAAVKVAAPSVLA
jgi:hypothetical protein